MTREEIWNNIEKLSELRSKYSCFDEEEEPFYNALSLGIKGIKALEQESMLEPLEENAVKTDKDKQARALQAFNNLDEWLIAKKLYDFCRKKGNNCMINHPYRNWELFYKEVRDEDEVFTIEQKRELYKMIYACIEENEKEKEQNEST